MEHRRILDRLALATSELRSLKEAPSPFVPKEKVLRLAFRRGQMVVDKVTGLKGEVIDGTRTTFEV